MITSVGEIGNHYAKGLSIKEEDGKYYWGIEDYNGTYWEEIPEYLYKALIRFETKGLKNVKHTK